MEELRAAHGWSYRIWGLSAKSRISGCRGTDSATADHLVMLAVSATRWTLLVEGPTAVQTPSPVVKCTEPLAKHPAFASSDLAIFRQYLSQTYCDHTLRARSHDMPLQARHNRLALSAISLNYLSYGADVEIDVGPFGTFFMLEFPQNGRVRLGLGSQQIDTHPGFATMISPTVPVVSTWSADCAQVMIQIARSALEAHLAELIGRPLPYELIFDPIVDFATPEAASLLRFCWFLVDELGERSPVLAAHGMTRDLEHAFMSALLTVQSNNYSDILRTRANPVMPRHIRRAMDHIKANLRGEIVLEALVEISGVSKSALYTGFRSFVGMPPQMVIRNMRLDGVREELFANSGGQTVAEIAMRWGFSHLGRFSRDYRQRFGESPRDTLRR